MAYETDKMIRCERGLIQDFTVTFGLKLDGTQDIDGRYWIESSYQAE